MQIRELPPVIVKVPCIDRSKVPQRPRPAQVPGTAINQQAAGASADARDLELYADKLEALQSGCYTVDTSP